MEQAPNVFIIFFAETTITFGWNIPGDTPNALKILRASPNPIVFGEFTPNDPGFFSSEFQNTGLQPGTLYTYQVCCEYSDQTLCGTVSQRTSGTPPPPPPPNPTITITGAQAFPARLVMQMNGKYIAQENGINLTWQSSVEVFSNISWTVTAGGVTTGVNVGGEQTPALSGTLTINPPDKRVLGLLCEVRISALPVNATQSIFSQSFAVQDPANTHSVRDFLSQSGIDPSKGIRNLLQTLPVSFRGMMQI
jgi:hypothetical protein